VEELPSPTGGNIIDHAVLWDKGDDRLNNLIGRPGVTCDSLRDQRQQEIVGTMMGPAGNADTHHFRLSPVVTLPVPVSSFTASGSVGIAGYLLTETNVTPDANDIGWSTAIPTSYSFTGYGIKNVCAWVKDPAGNISAGACTKVNIIRNAPPTVGWFTMPAQSAHVPFHQQFQRLQQDRRDRLPGNRERHHSGRE
jgi:hypothetical protein